MTKIFLTLALSLFLIATASPAANGTRAPSVKCANQVSINRKAAQSCENLKTESESRRCFDKIFVGNSSIELGYKHQLHQAKYLDLAKITCITFNGATFKVPVVLGYNSSDDVPYARSSHLLISTNYFKFIGYFCGWELDGIFRRKLSPSFVFIPPGTPLTPNNPKCRTQGELYVEGVALNTEATICEMNFAANTTFGYAPDDQYHFTALNDGTMKGTDKLGKPIDIPIKKGKDYRNADPAKYPCAWEETPEEVLKSFTEEHSE